MTKKKYKIRIKFMYTLWVISVFIILFSIFGTISLTELQKASIAIISLISYGFMKVFKKLKIKDYLINFKHVKKDQDK